MYKKCVIGLEGFKLTAQEIEWLQFKPPRGVILFARNVQAPEQVKALLSEVRRYAGNHTWAVIDEEGGRVHRMPWAPFHRRTQAAVFGALYAKRPEQAVQETFTDAYNAGQALKLLGFTHNCAPVLDIFYTKGDPVIGNRAYAACPKTIAALATATMFALHDAGIDAIGKHFPGHGRADVDSHLAMPQVYADKDTILAEADAFSQLLNKGLKHMMTAHVTYPRIDKDVATFSNFWLQDVLRVRMGFKGEIWSDDLCMKGCGMGIADATKAAVQAGCTTLLVCEPEGVKDLMEAFD